MKPITSLLALLFICASGSATAQRVEEPKPSPAFNALVGTDLEMLVRHHSILANICSDFSLDDQLVKRSMLLHIRLLGSELKDMRTSEELTWLTNAYFVAYAAGMEPMVGHIEKDSPGFKAKLCRVTRDNAVSLLTD